MPVKKERRFFVIWLNGVLIYAIPCFASVLVSLLYGSAQGLAPLTVWGTVLWTHLTAFALYLALYHLCILAVMLTGHIVFTVFFIGILQGYELLMQGLYFLMMDEFFRTYVYNSEIPLMLTSPYFQVFDPSWWSLLVLPLQILAFLALAYFAYSKRQADAVGRALAFRIAEPVLKVALAVPATIVMAMVFRSATQYGSYGNEGSPIFIIVASVITVTLVCCLLEVIYEFDIKAAIRQKRYILICGGAAALIFLAFRFDIAGYDRYIPRANSLASYAVVVPGAASDSLFDKEGGYISTRDYASANMYATDIASILALAALQPGRNPTGNGYGNYEYDDLGRYNYVYVLYRLKSGREVKRLVYINHNNQQTQSLLNSIVSTEEYKKGAYVELADYFDAYWLEARERGWNLECSYRYYQDGWAEEYVLLISRRDVPRLFEAYRQDLRAMNYYDIIERDDYEGEIRLALEWDQRNNEDRYNYSRRAYANIAVSRWAVRTREVLRELGVNFYNYEWLWQPEYEGGL
jgi:ABC-2 type transport system permease protein